MIIRAIPLLLSALVVTLTLAGCEQLDKLDELWNGKTEKTVKVTVPPEMQSDANSTRPAISADGRFVAFRSDGTNLVIAPTNGASAIYVKDVQTGRTVRVSTNSDGTQGNKDSGNPDITADGRLVVFDSSSANLVADDTNNQCALASGTNVNCVDVWLKDIETGVTTRVSTSAANGQGNRESSEPVISDDGRFVAFKSGADNLVPGDTNGMVDIFVKDTQSGSVQRVSTDAAGAEADAESGHVSLAADGRFVAFSSVATNLVPDDINGKRDIFVKDTQTGAVVRVSVDAAGGEGVEDSYNSVSISSDGRWVVFRSDASNLVPGDTNNKKDIFLKDTQSGVTTRVSTSTSEVL